MHEPMKAEFVPNPTKWSKSQNVLRNPFIKGLQKIRDVWHILIWHTVNLNQSYLKYIFSKVMPWRFALLDWMCKAWSRLIDCGHFGDRNAIQPSAVSVKKVITFLSGNLLLAFEEETYLTDKVRCPLLHLIQVSYHSLKYLFVWRSGASLDILFEALSCFPSQI